MHLAKGNSMTKIKRELKGKGICLGDERQYGSGAALKKELRACPEKRIPRDEVKGLKYCKQCLVGNL